MSEMQKVLQHQDEAQAIGDFLEWLFGQGVMLCSRTGDVRAVHNAGTRFSEGFVPISRSIEQLLAMYFGIDLDKLQQEREEVLAEWLGTHPRRIS